MCRCRNICRKIDGRETAEISGRRESTSFSLAVGGKVDLLRVGRATRRMSDNWMVCYSVYNQAKACTLTPVADFCGFPLGCMSATVSANVLHRCHFFCTTGNSNSFPSSPFHPFTLIPLSITEPLWYYICTVIATWMLWWSAKPNRSQDGSVRKLAHNWRSKRAGALPVRVDSDSRNG